MKKLFYLIIIIFTLASCKENEHMVYEAGYKIYFGGITAKSDSLTVSLANKPNGYEYKVTVKLIGEIPKTDMKFRVGVIPERSTAQEGVHYKALEANYIFPAGKSTTTFPIILYNQDPILNEKNMILSLRFIPSDGIELAYENRSVARLRISTILKTPEGTGYYGDLRAFNNLFGEYSKVKHGLIIDLLGYDLWDKSTSIYDQIETFTPYARALYVYIRDNQVYDENGKLIELWKI